MFPTQETSILGLGHPILKGTLLHETPHRDTNILTIILTYTYPDVHFYIISGEWNQSKYANAFWPRNWNMSWHWLRHPDIYCPDIFLDRYFSLMCFAISMHQCWWWLAVIGVSCFWGSWCRGRFMMILVFETNWCSRDLEVEVDQQMDPNTFQVKTFFFPNIT